MGGLFISSVTFWEIIYFCNISPRVWHNLAITLNVAIRSLLFTCRCRCGWYRLRHTIPNRTVSVRNILGALICKRRKTFLQCQHLSAVLLDNESKRRFWPKWKYISIVVPTFWRSSGGNRTPIGNSPQTVSNRPQTTHKTQWQYHVEVG